MAPWDRKCFIESMPILDTLQRPLRDLRISVTDRCNFRCTYCMPRAVFGPDFKYLERSALLSFEEIARVAGAALGLGVEKIRLTGGEPLLRRDLPSLVRLLAQLPGLRDLGLTTNGALLARLAPALRDAGLMRITVSLDSLDDRIFREMNDTAVPVAEVLAGIQAAKTAGFSEIKINMVVRRGVNDHELLPMASFCRGENLTLRLIEFMDVGTTNGWRPSEVFAASEMIQIIGEKFIIEPVAAAYRGEVARRFRYTDTAGGEIGVIASVSQPFCGDCSRLRLSSEGKLYTCLFSGTGADIRALLRAGASDADIAAKLKSIWALRADRYSEERARLSPAKGSRKVEMSHIGG